MKNLIQRLDEAGSSRGDVKRLRLQLLSHLKTFEVHADEEGMEGEALYDLASILGITARLASSLGYSRVAKDIQRTAKGAMNVSRDKGYERE